MGKKTYKKTGGKTLTKKVKALTKMVNADNATHTHRMINTHFTTVGKNLAAYDSIPCHASADIETALTNLRYYDPATPGTLVTAAGGTGTFSRKFGVHALHSKLTIRANYQVPGKVTVYLLQPKVDTSIDPISAMTTGLADQGNPSVTSPSIYPTDSDNFRDLWSIVYSKSIVLQPGQERTFTSNEKPFEYDPSLFDTHGLTFQKAARAKRWLIRTTGILAHDSTTGGLVGLNAFDADIFTESKYVFKYDAGTNLNDFTISGSYDAIPNGRTCIYDTSTKAPAR